MKKSLLLALLLTVIQTVPAFAVDSKSKTYDPYRYLDKEIQSEKRWGLGFNVSQAWPAEDKNSDSSAYVGGVVTYGIRDQIDLQLDVGYLSFGQEAFGLDYGDLRGIPMIFSARLYRDLPFGQPKSEIYLLAGVGMVFWDLDENSALAGNANDPADSLAWRVGTGLDIFVMKNFSLNLEMSYTFSEEDLDLSNPSSSQVESIDTDFWQMGGGAKYVFD